MQLVVSYAEREERLEDTAKRRAAWKKKFARMESERLSNRMELLSIVDYEEFMEVDMVARDVSLDLDVIMMDDSVRKPSFAVKSMRRSRRRMLKVTGRVKELGLVMEMSPKHITSRVKESSMEGDTKMNHQEQEDSTSSTSRMGCRWRMKAPRRQEQVGRLG